MPLDVTVTVRGRAGGIPILSSAQLTYPHSGGAVLLLVSKVCLYQSSSRPFLYFAFESIANIEFENDRLRVAHRGASARTRYGGAAAI